MLSSYSQDVEIYFPVGRPTGIDMITTYGITLTPILLSATPSIGSPAGSLITAVVKGVGVKSPQMTLVKSDNSDICLYSNIT